MQAQYPEDGESPEAREGTAAHHYATENLLGRVVAVGELAPNGHPIDAEMVDCAEDLLRDVRDTMKSAGNGILRVEHRVAAAATVHPQNWGTPDVYLFDRFRRTLHLWDYKYGHRYVDVYLCWQIVNYVLAVLETEGVPQSEWAQWQITMTIAQPRNYHPDGPLREWHTSGETFIELVTRLRTAAYAAMDPNAPFRTGDHCRDCTGRHACPALQRVAMREVDMTLHSHPVDLPPGALGLELRILKDAMKRLKARAEGLEEHALSLARKGVDVPHWRAEYSYGRERWKPDVDAQELAIMGEHLKIDMLAKPKAITPKQARDAGFPDSVIKACSETPRGPMTLVPFNSADVAKRFS